MLTVKVMKVLLFPTGLLTLLETLAIQAIISAFSC